MRILCLPLFLLSLAKAFYNLQEDGIPVLDYDDFQEKVLASDKYWFVEFYAPWCGHCKKLIPEFKKAKGFLEGVVNFAAVDAT